MSRQSINSVTGTPGATVNTMNSLAGKWALITGASSGLGLEFADLLAAQKVNLVLVARRQEPMEKLASDLRRKYGVDVLVEAIDLASPGGARSTLPSAPTRAPNSRGCRSTSRACCCTLRRRPKGSWTS
jgi:uncharacterized protein